MKQLHPGIYALTFAGLIVCLIAMINAHTQTNNIYHQLQNTIKEVQASVKAVENDGQKDAKDINRFQTKKYGVEPVTAQDMMNP